MCGKQLKLHRRVTEQANTSKCNDWMRVIKKFVRYLTISAFVVAWDRQLDDLVRFCTIWDGFTVLTVDLTWDFDVTPTSYQQCLLKSALRQLTCLHWYNYARHFILTCSLGFAIVASTSSIWNWRWKSISRLFHDIIHLTCFVHCHQNIKTQDLPYSSQKHQGRKF